MTVYRFLALRTKARRACAVCGTPLPPVTPPYHCLCRKCWSGSELYRAVHRFLEAARGEP